MDLVFTLAGCSTENASSKAEINALPLTIGDTEYAYCNDFTIEGMAMTMLILKAIPESVTVIQCPQA